ncbi:lysozyme inhibitor LprI family protein [Bradyrhizobium sp. WSM3983]|uniref:lysozyme inhibitor LprI family protein n=1 Tax=Bradyrhizobium sp. WSM3983 TaxID=1038867 RepID=UPI0003FAC468|nr:lysozyme inhibitor LprI family protein [Bradyrhizobium sp. WSM3983]
MRMIVLTVLALLALPAAPGFAQSGTSERSVADRLPLFARNNCQRIRDPGNQLFCGDAELAAAAERLSTAIEARLARLPDRLPGIEENAIWIRQRNLGCGIVGQTAIRADDFGPVKACLLKVTDDRATIVRDPDFDCLAANTAAGALICADPSLALTETELNSQVLGLIGKLDPTAARFAFAEYGRWTRERDRKCNLVGKENVPLAELESAEDCLADYLKRKTDEITAAKGDPKKVFGRQVAAREPDTDAVDFCAARIHAAHSCGNFLRINRVYALDSQVTDQEAQVTGEIEMVVLAPFTACSKVASSCTGTCWDPSTGRPQPGAGDKERATAAFNVTRRLRIQRTFAFVKAADGWRCREDELAPVNSGNAGGGS